MNIDILTNNFEHILRLLMAAVCGAIIGYERTSRHKEAGIRTHVIVSMSAALMMLISKYGFFDQERYDGSRIAAQIVSGVGFLGAGIIFVKDSVTVSGLTTAAGIWGTAGVGMAVASGMYTLGIVSSLFIVFTNYFLKSSFTPIREQKVIIVEILLNKNKFDVNYFMEYNHLRLISLHSSIEENFNKIEIKANYYVDELDNNKLINQLNENKNIENYKFNFIS